MFRLTDIIFFRSDTRKDDTQTNKLFFHFFPFRCELQNCERRLGLLMQIYIQSSLGDFLIHTGADHLPRCSI